MRALRKRTPTLLTHLEQRGLEALDRIEAAGWKLTTLRQGAEGWHATIKREGSERSISLCANTADRAVDELASYTREVR